MPTTNLSGVRIAYDDRGMLEPALLFMPDWCINRNVFNDLLVHCGAGRRVLNLDWRGHGESGPATRDFGLNGLVEDALAVVKASGVRHVVPVALAHAGWAAIQLRQRLKAQIPKLILLDWNVTEPPQELLDTLQELQNPDGYKETVEALLQTWLKDSPHARLNRFVYDEIRPYGFEMWARAARMISTAYTFSGSPLDELCCLEPPIPVLHLCSQPKDEAFLASQQSFAAEHPWFQFQKLAATSHFAMFEIPADVSAAINKFMG